ncbi:hypothetical protein Tco_0358926 [Tanacetum coccineum]
MDIKWQMAMLSVRVNKFEKKAGRKIEFDKKEAARFNKKAVRCYKCLQKGHFAREYRAKGGNKKRYSSFKIQELGKKEADTKALIIVDTLENWKEHKSGDDEGFAPKEYGMVAGCGAACEEGVAEVYSLITRNDTDAAAGEFALMGMTSEDGMTLHLVYLLLTLKKWKVDLISIVTSLRGNTKTLDASDSSVKSSEPKSNDSTSCASTSSVSTSESEAEIESNVGTPIQEPILFSTSQVWQDFFIPTARPNQVPAGRPKSVSTGRPKPVSTGAPVSTGKQNRPPPVHAGRRNSSFSYFWFGGKLLLDLLAICLHLRVLIFRPLHHLDLMFIIIKCIMMGMDGQLLLSPQQKGPVRSGPPLQAPPSPDYVPGPEEPEQAPPSPDYVPGPEHDDDEIVAEDQPYAEDALPIALSPDYIHDSDLRQTGG